MPIWTDLFYLPPIEYFVAILDHEEVIIDLDQSYEKQTYRNRAKILLANKVETISVPVFDGNKKRPYREIKIDYGQKWKNVHLRGIKSAYGKAPFFEFFFPYFEQVYSKNLTYLTDLNIELLTVCLKLLKSSSTLTKDSKKEENGPILDLRGIIKAKQPYQERNIIHPTPYTQMFGLDFEPNLSILDLLFCQGMHASAILRTSKKIE